ncbi:MAG: hypothetical protein ACREQB_03270 [Candidatus Binataceae bacterium]
MEPFFKAYIAAWAAACVAGLLLYLRRPSAFAISRRDYWSFLAEPWKLATFLAGAALITLVAPYTGDPTWDYVDGLFMSILCFATAPWVVATLYFAVQKKARIDELYLAVCAWLFSASWSYDLYLVLRDGRYPDTWLANLFASSVIYICAGLFWNLEYRAGRGVIFSFMREGWPSRPQQAPVWRFAVYALIFAAPAIAAVLMFLL